VALIKECVDCKAEVQLVGYMQNSPVQSVYAYYCPVCGCAFKLVETKKTVEAAALPVAAPPYPVASNHDNTGTTTKT
jgi:hypothetical protein